MANLFWFLKDTTVSLHPLKESSQLSWVLVWVMTFRSNNCIIYWEVQSCCYLSFPLRYLNFLLCHSKYFCLFILSGLLCTYLLGRMFLLPFPLPVHLSLSPSTKILVLQGVGCCIISLTVPNTHVAGASPSSVACYFCYLLIQSIVLRTWDTLQFIKYVIFKENCRHQTFF